MFFLTIFIFITLAMRGGVMLYYFKYYLGREDLFSIFNVFGLGATIVGVVGVDATRAASTASATCSSPASR